MTNTRFVWLTIVCAFIVTFYCLISYPCTHSGSRGVTVNQCDFYMDARMFHWIFISESQDGEDVTHVKAEVSVA